MNFLVSYVGVNITTKIYEMQKKSGFLNNTLPFYRFFLLFNPCNSYFYVKMLKSPFFSILK